MQGTRIQVIAHRGVPSEYPENTLPGFIDAVRQGATGLEVDAAMTADGEIVCWHDQNPDGGLVAFGRNLGFERGMRFRPLHGDLTSIGRAPMHQLTLQQVREHLGYAGISQPAAIPTLGQLAPLLREHPRLEILLDLKVPTKPDGLLRAFAERFSALRHQGLPLERVTLLHSELTALRLLREYAGGSFVLGYDVELGGMLALHNRAIVNSVAADLQLAVMALGVPHVGVERWSSYLHVLRHERQACAMLPSPVRIVAWTLNEERSWNDVVSLVDGIVTDKPGQLASFLARRGL